MKDKENNITTTEEAEFIALLEKHPELIDQLKEILS